MTNWKPGMKAVCVKTHSMPGGVVKDQVYVCSGSHFCFGCGGSTITVGIIDDWIRGALYRECGNCTAIDVGTNDEWRFAISLFRPLLSNEQEALDRIEQEVESEQLVPA